MSEVGERSTSWVEGSTTAVVARGAGNFQLGIQSAMPCLLEAQVDASCSTLAKSAFRARCVVSQRGL